MAELNPYRDPGPWGIVAIGGARVPGVVESIDGASRPDEWQVQKPTEKSGATTVWKGTNIAQSIKVVTGLHDAKSVDDYYALRRVLRPKQGEKPPSHSIVNAAINFSEITTVACRDILPPRWVSNGGYWRGELDLIDYSPPKPAKTGAAGAARAGSAANGGAGESDPNADLQAQINELLTVAKKL